MRIANALLGTSMCLSIVLSVPNSAKAQTITNFKDAIREAESFVFSKSPPASKVIELSRLLEITNFVDFTLGASEKSSITETASESELRCVPRTVCGGCFFFRRKRVIWEQVLVPVPQQKRTVEMAMTVLRRHAKDLLVEIDKAQTQVGPVDDTVLQELARQVYSLAVIAKEPFK